MGRKQDRNKKNVVDKNITLGGIIMEDTNIFLSKVANFAKNHSIFDGKFTEVLSDKTNIEWLELDEISQQQTVNQRPNLKDIRDALNQIPEDTLQISSIAIDFAITEDADERFKIMWTQPDDASQIIAAYAKIREDFEEDHKNAVQRLVDCLNSDLEQAKLREGEPGFDSDYNSEGDW
jgi:hypothetical protein